MAVAEPIAGIQAKPSRWQRTWKSISIIFESRVATVGLVMVLFWLLIGLISIVWTPYPPNESLFIQNLGPSATFLITFAIIAVAVVLLIVSGLKRQLKIGGIVLLIAIGLVVVAVILNGDSPNMLGTDNLGRDIASRLMTGTQVILLKTRIPEATLSIYARLIAGVAFLLTLPSLFGVIGRLAGGISRRILAAGLVIWAAALIVFVIFRGTLPLWLPFAVVVGVPYLIFLLYGWIKALVTDTTSAMLTWTITFLVAVVLYVVSFFVQEVMVSIPWLPLGVAIWGVIGSLIVGSILGLNAGYRGGWWDQTIMQGLDALIAFPVIVLYLVVISALGRGDLVVILAIAVTGAPGVARLVRSLALDIKTRDYIRAAETRGESTGYIMLREILPNARGPILVDAMLRVGYAIFAIGTLGFLGIGLPPPDPDWGSMVNEARQFIFSNQAAVIWPAITIASLVIGLNLFADGLREELTRYQK